MSAGTGVYHSEYNLGDDTLRFLQVWILPDNTGYKPNYGDYRFTWEERKNKWLHMVSSKSGNAPIKINQDFNIYSIELDKNEEIDFPVNKGRQAYILQVEGSSSINEILLNERDAAEVIEENIYIKAKNTSHILVLEMKKDE
ncbi:Quercetin 2,3-dioxygenase [compost metagenome]